jgi:aminomethyltransferase
VLPFDLPPGTGPAAVRWARRSDDMLRKTPLHAAHVAAKARLVDFLGWEMPVQYRGIVEETRQVRQHAGLFDLGHMGRLVVTGPDREALVERIFSANLGRMKVGKAKYGFLLNEHGFPHDDVIVYRDTDAVHIVINAGNRDRDDAWVREQRAAGGFRATVANVSDEQAMIAIQGRDSEATMQPLTSADLSQVPYYGFAHGRVCGVDTLIARTGYTGEDGFEIFPARDRGLEIWDAILGAGKPFGVTPIGLGARDALRLEAGMPLYGNEIDLTITPLEAGLDFGVDLTKEGTIGIPALRAQKAKGLSRKMVSFVAHSGRVPRHGYELWDATTRLGTIASGTASPTLGRNIGTGLVPMAWTAIGSKFEMDVRGSRQPCEVVAGPFYKRAR